MAACLPVQVLNDTRWGESAEPTRTLDPSPPARDHFSHSLAAEGDPLMLSHCEVLPHSSIQTTNQQCTCWHARVIRCPLLSRRGSSVSLRANVSQWQPACACSRESSPASVLRQQQGRHSPQETCRLPAHAMMVACLAAAVIAAAGFAPSPAWAEKKEVKLRDVDNPVLQSGKVPDVVSTGCTAMLPLPTV